MAGWTRRSLIWLLLGMVLPCACCHSSLSRPMPVQRKPPAGPDPPAWGSFVNFGDPGANDYIVRDIDPTGSARWARDHPEMRFLLVPRPGLRFDLTIWIAEQTLRDTGPVTVTVRINGHPLGSIFCPAADKYRMDLPVPIEWLHTGEPVHVLVEASPLWTGPDGLHFAYLITEAGFR